MRRDKEDPFLLISLLQLPVDTRHGLTGILL